MRSVLAIVAPLIFFFVSSYAADSYQYFDNWENLKDYHIQQISPLISNLDMEEQHDILDHSHILYKDIEAYTFQIFEALKNQFPNDIHLKNAPRILITDTETANAMVISEDPASGLRPNYIIVDKGLLSYSKETIFGVITHELIHHTLQNTHFKNQYYFSNGTIAFGHTIRNDKALESFIKKYMNIASLIGPFSNSELLGIPLNKYLSDMGILTQQLRYLVFDRYKNQCKKSATLLDEYIDVMNRSYSDKTGTLKFKTAEDSQSAEKLSSSFETELIKCLECKKISFTLLTANAYDLDIQTTLTLLKTTDPQEIRIRREVEKIFLENNLADALLNTTKTLRHVMKQIEDQVNFEDVRIYTAEDHADEVTVLMLNQLQISAKDYNSYLIEDEQSCNFESIDVHYGSIINPHHDSCWRAFRNTRLEESLPRES